jgi:cephalosporin hydroxylase
MVGKSIALQSGITQTIYHVGRLAEFMQCGELLFANLDELICDQDFLKTIEKAVGPVASWKTKSFESIFDLRLYRIVLYVLVRALKPVVAVETGVLHGLTTIFLLQALRRNGSGQLISVDMPSYPQSGPANEDGYRGVLPVNKEPGWIVPRDTYHNWQLRIGVSQDILPKLASENLEIDFFCHDSEHTFRTMWFELDWAWKHLKAGGVIVCDNIEASTAFVDFARRVARPPLLFPGSDANVLEQPRFGVLVK